MRDSNWLVDWYSSDVVSSGDDEDAGEAKPNGEERAENAQTATTGEPENKAWLRI